MRLFVAIELPEELRKAAGKRVARLALGAPEAKWVSAEKMHLTLAFLGEVAEEQVVAVQAAVETTARAHQELTLAIKGGGAFGTKRHPRVLWLGVEGELEALGALQKTLVENLLPTGFEPEHRDFRAHLTLARAREQRGDPELANAAEQLVELDLGTFPVDRLALIRSQLSPKGATHTPVFYAALKKRP